VSNINVIRRGTRASPFDEQARAARLARRNCCGAWRHVGSGDPMATSSLATFMNSQCVARRVEGDAEVPALHPAAAWQASLDLRFSPRANRTALVHRRHEGPLQVQKALYPEGPEICHVALLHPPGGIAGCDRLIIRAAADKNSHAVMTTPGATKWYRSAGDAADQRLQFALDGDSVLEWLPRENILFDGCRASMNTEIRLSGNARYLGWEILCFGRRASGEHWRRGNLRLDTCILRDGRIIWAEHAQLSAGSGFTDSPVGLAGFSVSATFLAAGFEADAALLQHCRALPVRNDGSRHGVTWLPRMLCARYLGDSSEDAFGWFSALWALLRPALLGRAAQVPRLWAC
jgi:urease accessory protein